MIILGNIVKEAIQLASKFTSGHENPHQAQQQVLRELLEKAKKTRFGKHYGFQKILSEENPAQAFADTVPIHHYHEMSEWWDQTEEGLANVTWPGKPSYLALSSGTTSGKSKKIPVTEDMLIATRKSSLRQITCLANFDIPAEVFEKEILMLGGSTNLKWSTHFPEGDISGINAANIPFWFKNYYRPGAAIAAIDDWEQRILKIAEEAPMWDIGALSGIPSWIELMLKKIISINGLNTIHEIWPNLSIFATGGVAYGPYQKSFNKLLAKPLTYIDTYFCSEGFLAFQANPDTTAMALVLDNGIYFEFVPFNESNISTDGNILPEAEVLTINDIKENEEYALIISTVSGAWRYVIGDTIKFTSKKNSEILITGRTSQFLNVVGSKLSVAMMDAGIQKMAEALNITVKEFTVSAVLDDDDYAHHWYIGTDEKADHERASKVLDQYLQEINHNYKTARNQALKRVIVTFIPPDIFYKWNEMTNKKGGQVKMPRVLKEEQFAEWKNFVNLHVKELVIG